MEWNVAEIDPGIGYARMVGDDTHRLHRQFADPTPVEKVRQAMIELRRQQEEAVGLGEAADGPVHAEGLGNRRDLLPTRVELGASHDSTPVDQCEDTTAADTAKERQTIE